LKLNDFVYSSIKNVIGDIKKIKTSSTDILIKNIYANSKGKPIKAFPLSLGYSKEATISGEVIYIENLEPSVILRKKELKDKILYIKDIDKHSYIKYLKIISPKAVLTNRNFYRKAFIEEFPLIYTPTILEDGTHIDISLILSEKKYKSKNYFVDIGLGGRFIIILFPFDSRFQAINDLAFWGSLQLFLMLMRRLKNISSNTLKIRFLAIDFKYTNYIELKKHLEHIDKVLAIYNLDHSGIGNEKLVIKTDRYIIDKYHFEKINEIFRKRNTSLYYDILSDYVEIEIKKPIIWFNSQPNEYLYILKKEFLNKNLYLDISDIIYEIITNSYKGVKVNA